MINQREFDEQRQLLLKEITSDLYLRDLYSKDQIYIKGLLSTASTLKYDEAVVKILNNINLPCIGIRMICDQYIYNYLYLAISSAGKDFVKNIITNSEMPKDLVQGLVEYELKKEKNNIEMLNIIIENIELTEDEINKLLHKSKEPGYNTVIGKIFSITATRNPLYKHFSKLGEYKDKLQKIDPENKHIKDILSKIETIEGLIKSGELEEAKKEFNTISSKEINSLINNLQSISKVKTLQNILATILSCLACIIGVGVLPLLNNYKERGNCFMFFTEGAKQNAEMALQETKKLVNTLSSYTGNK